LNALYKKGYKHQLGDGMWKFTKGSLRYCKKEALSYSLHDAFEVCGGRIDMAKKILHQISTTPG